MKCFISKNYRHMTSAGDKAKTDVEAIMLREGFQNIGLGQRRVRNTVAAYFITLASVVRSAARIKEGDVVVLQYPLKKYYDFVVDVATRRKAKVVTLIHDLGCFRRKKLTVAEEVERLNRSSALIVHSPAMRQWLLEHGVTVPMTLLGLWDFLSPSKPAEGERQRPSARPELAFAGELDPRHNEWLYELAALSPDVDLVLYGGGLDRQRASANMIAMGYVDPDSLIADCRGDYGLVWYGSSLDEGSGNFGEYLKYNAPHKTSLYLRAGLPVIIWDQAGLAPVVRDLDVGICVSSLRDLGRQLAAVTPERYAALRANARRVGERLASGSFVAEALQAALQSAE